MTRTPKAVELQRARRKAFVAAGLTVYGTRRKNYQWPELDDLSKTERMNERIRISTLRSRRALKNGGLALAMSPKNHYRPAAWKLFNRIFKAEIDAAAADMGRLYEYLDPVAQSRCVQLSHSLSKLRGRLL